MPKESKFRQNLDQLCALDGLYDRVSLKPGKIFLENWSTCIYRILHECLFITEVIKLVGEKIRCEAVPSILSVCLNKFNKFNNIRARMQDSIYHMTLKSHFISKFFIKTSRFRH